MPSARLHLDVTAGARGDMLAGALVAVGADMEACRAAIAAIGGDAIDVVVEHVKRAGLSATRVRFLVDGADLFHDASHDGDPKTRGHFARIPSARRRHALARPRFEDAKRAPLEDAKTAAAVEDVPAIERFGAGVVVNDPGAASRKKAKRRSRSTLATWLDTTSSAGSVAFADVVDVVKHAELPPIAKALALNALRRASDALVVVAGSNAHVSAHTAASLVVEIVAAAALVDALSPAAITASPIAIGNAPGGDEIVVDGRAVSAGWPTPSPWLLEILAGAPVLERGDDDDDASARSDVAGAALLRACVHRFGARGVATSTQQGLGAGAVDASGEALVARALVGPPTPVRSRAGERHVEPMCDLCARLPADVDRAALVAAVSAQGVRPSTIAFADVVDERGRRGVLWRGAAPYAGVDAVASLLWRNGAGDVTSSSAELLAPAVAEVTVPVGRGRTKAGVRVRVWKDGSQIARIEADPADVDAAVKKRGATPGTAARIEAEAIEAFSRVADASGATSGDGDDENDDE